jgi:uncharacterized protein
MSFEVLATLTSKALGAPQHRRIQFIWHGGEPLLLGQEFYLKALRLQRVFQSPGQMITNSLQTNGTLVDDGWCEFFKQFGFSIGLSVDGPADLHDRNRFYASGKGSFTQTEHAIRLFEKHRISFGVLVVLNRYSLQLTPRELFQFFLDQGVKTFAFLPARPNNVGDTTHTLTGDYVSPKEYVQFMRGIFDQWYALDDPSVHIRELNSLVSALVGGSVSICTLAGDCLGQYFHVEPGGDLFHCDKFLGDQHYRLGNIMRNTFQDIYSSDHFLTLVAEEKERLQLLRTCPWFALCKGGCPHDRYIAEKYVPGYDGSCCGQRELIDYICENVARDALPKRPSDGIDLRWHGT